jgi:3-oxoacyl-[acyl-carrier protein] reductase
VELGLRGRTAVVTGGSRGIGRTTAEMLVAEGARVLAVSRGGDAPAGEPVALDITEPGAGEALLAAAGGAVDILVNNAGTSEVKPLDALTHVDYQRQWELSVLGPAELVRALAPGMVERGWGRIVTVASSSGKRPSGTNVAYSVAKSAQLALSRAWADAYASHGVLANAVAPGPFATGLWMDPGGMADQSAAAQGISREEALERARARVPRGRYGTPAEIAAVVVFLCSERAANVAGAAWSVDGGAVPVII